MSTTGFFIVQEECFPRTRSSLQRREIRLFLPEILFSPQTLKSGDPKTDVVIVLILSNDGYGTRRKKHIANQFPQGTDSDLIGTAFDAIWIKKAFTVKFPMN